MLGSVELRAQLISVIEIQLVRCMLAALLKIVSDRSD